MNKYEHTLKNIQDILTVRVYVKERSLLMKVLYAICLMRFWNPEFMSSYTNVVSTPWSHHIFMPEELHGTAAGARVLRHEFVHAKDCNGWRWPFFILSYCILPVGPSFRAYWELRGYRESMVAYYEAFGELPEWYLDFIAKEFTGSTYLYMFPFPKTIRRILEGYRAEIVNGARV